MKPMLRLMQCHLDMAVQLVVTDQRVNDHVFSEHAHV
jgi:hypothetical protein